MKITSEKRKEESMRALAGGAGEEESWRGVRERERERERERKGERGRAPLVGVSGPTFFLFSASIISFLCGA